MCCNMSNLKLRARPGHFFSFLAMSRSTCVSYHTQLIKPQLHIPEIGSQMSYESLVGVSRGKS